MTAKTPTARHLDQRRLARAEFRRLLVEITTGTAASVKPAVVEQEPPAVQRAAKRKPTKSA